MILTNVNCAPRLLRINRNRVKGNLDDNVNYCNLVSGVYSLLRKLDTKRTTSESSSTGSILICFSPAMKMSENTSDSLDSAEYAQCQCYSF